MNTESRPTHPASHPRLRWRETIAAVAARALTVARNPLATILLIAAIVTLVLRRVPIAELADAIAQADQLRFFAVMVANTLILFIGDTLILSRALRSFHRPMSFGELFAARAASYVLLFLSTNAARGALALYLSRRLQVPMLSLLGTILFVVVVEYLHLFTWAAAAMIQPAVRLPLSAPLVPVAGAVLLVGTVWCVRGGRARRDDEPGAGPQSLWQRVRALAVLQTVRTATVSNYAQVISLLVPMLLVSICSHYLAAAAFGLDIPFGAMLVFLPWITMLMALPFTIGQLATASFAWLVLFGAHGSDARLVAFAVAANLTFVLTRTALGLVCLPWATRTAVRSLGIAAQ